MTRDELLALERAGTDSGPTPEDLARAIQLTARQAMLLADRQRLEVALASVNAQLKQNVESELPEAMLACRLFELPTNYGTVKLESFVTNTIKKADRPQAIEWCRAHDGEDLVKTTVTIAFAKGSEAKARAVAEYVEAEYGAKVNVSLGRTVAGSTMKKYVRTYLKRELHEPIERLPRELFGVFEGRMARLAIADQSLARDPDTTESEDEI